MAPNPSLPFLFDPYGPLDHLPTAFSKETGQPTKWRVGEMVVLRHQDDATKARLQRIDDAFMDIACMYDSLADVPPTLLAGMLQDVTDNPGALDAAAICAGALIEQGRPQEALDLLRPIATTLLEALPTASYIQLPYYALENRPFHRVMRAYLLACAGTGRDREADADAVAKRMLELCPSDNLGFRYLRTKSARSANAAATQH